MKRLLLCILITLASLTALAQHTVLKGKVTDIATGETLPMAQVHYVSNGETYGTTTDLNGNYRLESDKIFDYVTFQFAGYKPYTVKINRFTTQTINAKLESEVISLPKAEIKAKRRIKEKYKRKGNPAVELIKKVHKNAERNSLTGFDYYQYDEYSKFEMGPSNLGDSLANKRYMRSINFVCDNIIPSELTGRNYLSMYFVETLSKTYYRKNPRFLTIEVTDTKDVLLSKFLDFSSMGSIIDNWMGFVDVYQRNIRLFNNEYTSPMSPVAIAFYHYYIVDTVDYDNENCIVLAFTPSNQMDLGLCGSLWITNDTSYMVKKVQLQLPKHSGTNFVEAMMFEQEYEKVDSVMFPTRYSLVADLFYLGLAIHGKRSGVYSNIQINKPMPDDFYIGKSEKSNSKDFYAHKDDEEYWKARRTDSLSEHERRIAEDNDKLKKVWTFRLISGTLFAIGYNYIDYGPIDIGPVFNMLSHNDIEGWRLRFGAKTNTKFHKHIFLEGFLAYGTKDEKGKFRSQVMYSFNDKVNNQWEFPMNLLTMSYEHNTDIPGRELFGYNFKNDYDGLGRSLNRKTNNRMVFNDKVKLMYDYEFKYQIGVKLFAEYQEQTALGELYFQTVDGKVYNPFTTNSVGFELRYAHNERVHQIHQYRYPLATSVAPVFSIGYSYGGNLLGSDYEYHKIQGMFSKRWFLSVLGVADINVSCGTVIGDVPYPLLFVHRGNQELYYDEYAFNLMNYYEFLSQYYVQGIFNYTFNGFILNRLPLLGKFKLREVFSLKSVWGDVSGSCNPDNGNPNLFLFPTNSNGERQTYTLDDGPYIEGSVGIANIFSILRIDYVRRFSYLDHPHVDEWGIFFSLKVKF